MVSVLMHLHLHLHTHNKINSLLLYSLGIQHTLYAYFTLNTHFMLTSHPGCLPEHNHLEPSSKAILQNAIVQLFVLEMSDALPKGLAVLQGKGN